MFYCGNSRLGERDAYAQVLNQVFRFSRRVRQAKTQCVIRFMRETSGRIGPIHSSSSRKKGELFTLTRQFMRRSCNSYTRRQERPYAAAQRLDRPRVQTLVLPWDEQANSTMMWPFLLVGACVCSAAMTVLAAFLIGNLGSKIGIESPTYSYRSIFEGSGPSIVPFHKTHAGKRQFAFLVEKIELLNPKANADYIARLIVDESNKAGYDPLMVASVIKSESTFKFGAQSHKGARGLMQLMPGTAKYISSKAGLHWKGNGSLSDPAYNIRLGLAYVSYLEKMFDGDMRLALMAYNWGPGNVQKVLKRQKRMISPVSMYAQKILATHKRWHAEFKNS